MTKNARVSNVTRGFSLKHSQALKAVEACSCVWVEFGVSVRDLTLAESIAARNEQARLRDPLPFAEIPDLWFEAPVNAKTSAFEEYRLAVEANKFAAECAV